MPRNSYNYKSGKIMRYQEIKKECFSFTIHLLFYKKIKGSVFILIKHTDFNKPLGAF